MSRNGDRKLGFLTDDKNGYIPTVSSRVLSEHYCRPINPDTTLGSSSENSKLRLNYYN
jgi:hypothetical protein